MSRSYSDPSYGSKKALSFAQTAAINGTTGNTLIESHTFMEPVTVTDFNVRTTTAGNGTSRELIIGKSLGGTGTVALIGTVTVGTSTLGSVTDGAVVSTSFLAGDDLQVLINGTGATVATVVASVQYKETYVQSDT